MIFIDVYLTRLALWPI